MGKFLRFLRSKDNNLKHGRCWFKLDNEYKKTIGLEWSFKPWNIFNCNIQFDGSENDWTLNFWFIWHFWVTFEGIFKWYPKEWNSSSGSYLRTAKRKIGISQWDWSLNLYFWHDGEDSWYPDKCDKIWYKWIDFYCILTGGHCYKTIEEKDYKEYIDLPEKRYEIEISYRHWHKTYKRIYMKLFQSKGKSIRILENLEIKYPIRKQTEDDVKEAKKYPDRYHRYMKTLERTIENKWYSLKSDEDISVAIKKYRDEIIKLRSVESADWVPYDYRKYYYREQKLKRILDVY